MALFTIEALLPFNEEYHSIHKITQADVEMANNYKTLIEASRTKDRVQVGDILELTTQYGDYRERAHIESWDEDGQFWRICEEPYVPFIWPTRAGDNIACSTSGGPWTKVPNNLEYVGKRKKLFKDWGHCGSCASGALTFEVEVNVWEYVHPEPIFGEYSTKNYHKQYITYNMDERGNPTRANTSRYVGCNISFDTTEEYTRWLEKVGGIEFDGHWPNQKAVFYPKKNVA